ncbi:MAG: hypothetical protein OK438_00360 [Thaumarchaeota archaeon]|nr:hypothetical protein [Nitrososphaerota archaeon]
MEFSQVNLLGRKLSVWGGAEQTSEFERIRLKLDKALTTVFTEEGKKTVLFYMSKESSLTLEQASQDPARLERALTSLLGEIGWMVVKRKILEQLWERSIEMHEVSAVKNASLQSAFGFVRGFGLVPRTGAFG